MGGLRQPGVKQFNAEALEILGVAGRQNEIVGYRGSSNESIHRGETAAHALGGCHEVAPGDSNRSIDWDDALVKALLEIVGKPACQCIPPSAGLHQSYTPADFGNRNSADECPIFIEVVQPL